MADGGAGSGADGNGRDGAAEAAALALRAARAAGDLLLRYAAGPAVGVETKSSGTDMVSEADRAAERLILDVLLGARPEDGVLGEEGSERAGTSGRRWVVDPLDGTTNFLYGYPQWAVSIAYEDAEGPLAACVLDPSRDEAFVAARGGGATLNGEAIRIGSQADPAQALGATGFGYDPERRRRQAEILAGLIDRVRDVRRGGSAALDLAWTACGRLDAYYEVGLQPWDAAAGLLLVREAGGEATSGPTSLGATGFLAACPPLHARLAALLGAAGPGP